MPTTGDNISRKLWVEVLLCGSLCVASGRAIAQTSGFPSNWHIGPTKAEVVGAAIGVAAVITLVVYLSVPKQKTIEGCVKSTNGVNILTNENDHHSYELLSETVLIQPGHRLKLKGKKRKDKSGTLHLEVKKLVKEEGTCGT